MSLRLEKTLYERLLNTRFLDRARVVTKPSKFYEINPTMYMMAKAQETYQNSIFQRIAHPLAVFYYTYFAYPFQRDVMLTRGLLPHDIEIHSETTLRRGAFFENVLRQSCHPYEWLFFKYRRARFFKVEHALAGFHMPDYIRKDVEKVTMAEAHEKELLWRNFEHANFWSDMSPQSYWLRGKSVVFEFLAIYGLFRQDAWERYFLNEQRYDPSTRHIEDLVFRRPYGFDLETDEGRRKFEAHVNDHIQRFPGSLVPEGEKFDFKHFYAK